MGSGGLQRVRRGGDAVKPADAVMAEINRIAPPGIGKWAGVWERTALYDRAFCHALDRWQRKPTPAHIEEVTWTGEALIAAWDRAVADWRRHREHKDE